MQIRAGAGVWVFFTVTMGISSENRANMLLIFVSTAPGTAPVAYKIWAQYVVTAERVSEWLESPSVLISFRHAGTTKQHFLSVWKDFSFYFLALK